MISVCLATYNGEIFIKDQLFSILNQLTEYDEVIVVDDGSVDLTLSIIESINDKRVKLIKNEGKAYGVVKNFERALTIAKGDIIFLSDQDDVWLPNKVELCVQVLKKSLLVVTDCKVVDERLQEVMSSFFVHRKSGNGVIKNIFKNSYLGCCIAFRRDLLRVALPIPSCAPMHDMWLGLMAEIYGKVTFLPTILLLYRRHQNNASPTSGRSQLSIIKKISYRIILGYLILQRLIRNTFVKLFKLK